LNRILDEALCDAFVEGACATFYAPVMGRPSLAPGRYFRLLPLAHNEKHAVGSIETLIEAAEQIETVVPDSEGPEEVVEAPLPSHNTSSPSPHATARSVSMSTLLSAATGRCGEHALIDGHSLALGGGAKSCDEPDRRLRLA
jgi:hypothetical protein